MKAETQLSTAVSGLATRRTALTLALCGAAALAEGFDNQAMGVAGPALIREFTLSAATAGWLFSSGTFGQALGSLVGGSIADHIGRRWTLGVSLLLIGIGSIGTIFATGVAGLFLLRTLTGLGLGAAMPNFITLASESVQPQSRQRLVTLLMAGFPVGGTLASITSLGNGTGGGWRTIFVIGGTVPLIVGLLVLSTLSAEVSGPALAQPALRRPAGVMQGLFGSGRASATLLLAVGFFFMQLTLLLMLNWLPSLVVHAGYTDRQASWTQIAFSVSGILGSFVVGHLQGGARNRLGVIVTYLAIAAALAAVGLERAYTGVLLAAMASGVFVIGAQLALYALAPLFYPRFIRASGVGFAATAGRLGSVVGPLFAGQLLQGGASSATVLLSIVPFVLVAGAAVLALSWCRQATDGVVAA